jgi:BirA family biotin operon repressor/biotin-[acetyl-CoA-carboxylase] ligase
MPFTELLSVTSTNIYAADKLKANLAAHGAAFFAQHQTAGKGQRGKQWNDEPGRNIMLSIILDTSFLSTLKQFPFNAMIAISVHEFFSTYAGDETKIKWPNDLYWRDRKAGGILIESIINSRSSSDNNESSMNSEQKTATWKYAIVGIGININQTKFSADLPNPVSLKQITGKEFDSVCLAKELCNLIDKNYQLLKKGKAKKIITAYNKHLYKRNETVRLKKKSAAFNCIIKSVNENGELIVANAMQESFVWGEVQWVL